MRDPWEFCASHLSSWSRWDLWGESVSERRWRLWPTPWDRLWEVKAGCLRQGRWGPGAFLRLRFIRGEIPSSGKTILILGSGSLLKNWGKTPSQQWQQLAFPITSLHHCHPHFITTRSSFCFALFIYLFIYSPVECGSSHSCLSGQFGDSLRWRMHSTLELVGHLLPCSCPPHSQLGSCLPCCVTLNLWSLMSPRGKLTGQSSSSYRSDQIK